MAHGVIVIQNGQLNTKLKFHMLRTQMMVLSLWIQIPLKLHSTTSKSITTIQIGITTFMRSLVMMAHRKLSISQLDKAKNSLSQLIYMTTECMLQVANQDTHLVLSKFTRELPYWIQLLFPIKLDMASYITII